MRSLALVFVALAIGCQKAPAPTKEMLDLAQKIAWSHEQLNSAAKSIRNMSPSNSEALSSGYVEQGFAAAAQATSFTEDLYSLWKRDTGLYSRASSTLRGRAESLDLARSEWKKLTAIPNSPEFKNAEAVYHSECAKFYESWRSEYGLPRLILKP